MQHERIGVGAEFGDDERHLVSLKWRFMTIPRISYARAREAPRTWRNGHLPAAPERPNMTEKKFTALIAKQTPDSEKRPPRRPLFPAWSCCKATRHVRIEGA